MPSFPRSCERPWCSTSSRGVNGRGGRAVTGRVAATRCIEDEPSSQGAPYVGRGETMTHPLHCQCVWVARHTRTVCRLIRGAGNVT